MATNAHTSQEFNLDTPRAKAAAANGPVFIIDGGRLELVMLTPEEYEQLSPKHRTLGELIGMGEGADFDFDPPRLSDNFLRPADLD